ncbi:neuromedin-S isoform X1 [Manis javanica]|uniref:neuromedin-S isoform X1 n=1 Tax=Manis javanica TaxID=9974 RepID=UPI003C6D4077
MKHLPQFPPVLAIYCFCVLQIPASGFPQSFADLPDDLDIVQLERLAYWATLPTQPKDNQDIHKRFPPMHPLMHLAAKLANRTMKRFLLMMLPPWDDHFSFSGQGMEETLTVTPSKTSQEFNAKGRWIR